MMMMIIIIIIMGKYCATLAPKIFRTNRRSGLSRDHCIEVMKGTTLPEDVLQQSSRRRRGRGGLGEPIAVGTDDIKP